MKTLVNRFRPEQIRLLFLLVLMALMVVFFSIQIPGYFNPRFIVRESTSVAVVAVLAIGQTLVFLTRNFDLSQGSVVGLTAYFVGQQVVASSRHPTGRRGAAGHRRGRHRRIDQRRHHRLWAGALAHHDHRHVGHSTQLPGRILPCDTDYDQQSAEMARRLFRPQPVQHRPDRCALIVRHYDRRGHPLPTDADLLALRQTAVRDRFKP